MDTRYADLRLQMFAVARDCALLGGRPSTIAAVSGIPHVEVLQLFFDTRSEPRRGHLPRSVQWFFKANKLVQIECAIFGVRFERLREAGHSSSQALVGAYRQYSRCYLSLLHTPEELQEMNSTDLLTFDRAFFLAANLELRVPSDGALWLFKNPEMFLRTCAACRCRFVGSSKNARGSRAECPLCSLQDQFVRCQQSRNRGPDHQIHSSTVARLLSVGVRA